MGLFGLFGGDPASKWIRDPNLKLEVDVDELSLCGVKLGSRPQNLSRLGPPSNKEPTKNHWHLWSDFGVAASSADDILKSYSVIFFDPDLSPEICFKGTLLRGGRPLPITAETRLDDAVKILGEPWHRIDQLDEDDDLSSLYYATELREIVIEFLTPKRRLSTIYVSSPPNMASPRTREILGVTKPWPPA